MSIAEKLQTIAENEQKVYEAGYEKGKSESGDTETAYNSGYVDGKKTEYDEFWDSYQDYGRRTGYGSAFWGKGWNDTTFKPKYNLYPTSLNQAFRETYITDFVAIFEHQKVIMDTSNCTSFAYAFGVHAHVTHLGTINTTSANDINNMCINANGLHTIDDLILKKDGTQSIGSAFSGTTSLRNLKITGCIGKDFNIKNSAYLTLESITSIINALSVVVSGQTLLLSKQAVNTAFETADSLEDGSTSEEWLNLINTKSNWTITLS